MEDQTCFLVVLKQVYSYRERERESMADLFIFRPLLLRERESMADLFIFMPLLLRERERERERESNCLPGDLDLVCGVLY